MHRRVRFTQTFRLVSHFNSRVHRHNPPPCRLYPLCRTVQSDSPKNVTRRRGQRPAVGGEPPPKGPPLRTGLSRPKKAVPMGTGLPRRIRCTETHFRTTSNPTLGILRALGVHGEHPGMWYVHSKRGADSILQNGEREWQMKSRMLSEQNGPTVAGMAVFGHKSKMVVALQNCSRTLTVHSRRYGAGTAVWTTSGHEHLQTPGTLTQ